MESEIIYNPYNVREGKDVLVNAARETNMIAAALESGIEEIMASGYKGAVDIEPSQMENMLPKVDGIIRDIEYAETQIMNYSEKRYYRQHTLEKVWYQFEYNGTYYSSISLGVEQTSRQYEKCLEEIRDLKEKVEMGEANDSEIERLKYLGDKQLKLKTQATDLERVALTLAEAMPDEPTEGVVSYDAKDVDDMRTALNREKSD